MPLKIAVIGGGAAGLTAAYLLQQTHHVTVFERESRLGGHAHTVVLDRGPDAGTHLDVAFMVFNDRNYPTFQRLLDRLGGIRTRDSEMSFGYSSADDRVQYALNWRPGHTVNTGQIVRQPTSALLADIVTFFRRASRALESGVSEHLTYGDFLHTGGFSEAFIETYALPMGAALWSSRPVQVGAMPAAVVLQFYQNHGLLSLGDGPQWLTIEGGSRTYVDALQAAMRGRIVTSAPALRIFRGKDAVELRFADGNSEQFDHVVVATHADQALALLGDPDDAERALLGAWRYQKNRGVLHSDTTVMPSDRGAWASWNYRQGQESDRGPMLTYHLDRLQGLTGLHVTYFLTLNPTRAISPDHRHAEFTFTHPIFDAAARATQQAIQAMSGRRRTSFCGSYMGNGFHEDAVCAGTAVAAHFGLTL